MLREPEGPGTKRRPAGITAALRQIPAILRADANMRHLIVAVNLGALGFTAIPLITALAHRCYEIEPATVGWFVILQVVGMLAANVVWSRLIRRGGFRFVLRAELITLAALFPLSLIAARFVPLWGYAALYAGIFGAANLGTALMPLATGFLVRGLGFVPVFVAAALTALVALVPAGRIWCGEWWREGEDPPQGGDPSKTKFTGVPRS